MPIVPLWTGREVRALREARRMSVRDFAAHLGVSDRMVSKWEAGGESIRPRPLNQSALDTSLALADAEAQARYAQIIKGCVGSAGQRQAPRRTEAWSLAPEAVHLVRHPLDGTVMTLIGSGAFRASRSRSVWVPGYYIDVAPVTNVQYARFLGATGHRPPPNWPDAGYAVADMPGVLDDDPVTALQWADVCAYAMWTSKALPTATQWDRAARGREGFVAHEMQEWCTNGELPTWRGPSTTPRGGFRCVTPVADMLELLAI